MLYFSQYGSFNFPNFACLTLENETLQHMIVLSRYHGNKMNFVDKFLIV